jgi:hypothetical protein
VAKGPSKRVVYNRSVADALFLGLADGALAVADEIIAVAESDVPDAPAFGQGLVASGETVAYLDGKKIGGTATKPRQARLPKPGVAAFAGYSVFWAHFVHNGTIHMAPNPWFLRATNRVIPNAHEHIKPKVREALARVRK